MVGAYPGEQWACRDSNEDNISYALLQDYLDFKNNVIILKIVTYN